MFYLLAKYLQAPQEQTIVYTGLEIPEGIFTAAAVSLFPLIKDKLRELRIEPNEAREYFRQFTENISQIGFIPPLILNFLRDVEGKYQTLIISQNLSAAEEELIAACFKPALTASNEIAPAAENTVPSRRETGSLNDLYNAIMHYVPGSDRLAAEIARQAQSALEKLAGNPPLPAVRAPRRITQTPGGFNLQINAPGILAYLHKRAARIMQSRSNAPPELTQN
jgi:hypothetical protein